MKKAGVVARWFDGAGWLPRVEVLAFTEKASAKEWVMERLESYPWERLDLPADGGIEVSLFGKSGSVGRPFYIWG